MSFCHSREPSLDDALPLVDKSKDLFSSLRAAPKRRKGHRQGATSADSSIRYRHRHVQSIDWADWRQTTDDQEPSPTSGPKHDNEDDADLIAYRNEAGVKLNLVEEARTITGSGPVVTLEGCNHAHDPRPAQEDAE